LQVRSTSTSDLHAIHRLLSSSGWAHRIGGVEELGRLISASQRAVVAVADNEGSAAFFAKLGFKVSQTAMERPRH